MPGKKKGGKKKKKGGKKKRPKGMLEDPCVVVRRLYKSYLESCAKKKSVACPGLKASMKDCYENDRLIVKFILEPVLDFNDPELKNVSMDPVIASIRHEWYRYIKELHVWDLPIVHEQLANLALMLEKAVYPITRLDMVDCNLESISATRLVQKSSVLFLTSLCLDSNEFGDDGCIGLCTGLKGNTVMLSLSLCYCDLGVNSGKALGELISTTAIRDIYLNGNNLEAEGAIEIIKLAADQAEVESLQRVEEKHEKAEQEALVLLADKERSRVKTAISDGEEEEGEKPSSATSGKSGKGKKKKKGKGKKKKSKEPPSPPAVGPWIHKLHLADNGIDSYGPGSNYGPVITMRLFRQLLQHSSCFSELDLDDNLIGDLGGRDVMEGLKARKEEALPGAKVSVTHRMNGDTFGDIVKLGSGLQKKKKKGKGKKKKKK